MNPKELLQNGEATLLYEDKIVQAILPKKGASNGHIIVYPKKDAKTVDDLSNEEMEIFSFCSSYAATVLFETLGVHGTNFIINEEPLIAHVLGRMQDDGLNLMWQPKQLDPNEMSSAESKIKDASFMIDKEEPKKQKKDEPIKKEEIPAEVKAEEEKENYMIKQLIRIP